MSLRFVQKQNFTWLKILSAILVLLMVGVVIFWLTGFKFDWFQTSTQPKVSVQAPAKTPKPKQPKPVSAKSKLLVTGNSFWGRYTNDAAKKSKDRYKFPFSRLHEFKRDKYNTWITGMECPISKKGVNMTSAEMEADLTFNCDPAYLPEFAKWFDIVNLANNHADNMGEDGFVETQQNLQKAKVQHIGHYDPYKLDEICEVVNIEADVKYDDGSTKQQKLPIAICSYHFVFKLPRQDSIDMITKYAKRFPVIVLTHGGAEYKPGPDQIKTTLYRSMIDAGADMLLGDHPHWVQSTEVYKGRLIAYSMGNFMFDQQSNQEVRRSAVFDIELDVTGNLAGWLNLADQCQTYQDKCLALANQKDLKKIDPKYKFKVVVSDDTGYATHLASDAQRQAVLKRLNWQKTLKELEQE